MQAQTDMHKRVESLNNYDQHYMMAAQYQILGGFFGIATSLKNVAIR